MEDTEKDIEKVIAAIRNRMQTLKNEKYAITNPETAALDDYRKSFYLRILCSLVQYEKNPSDMQRLLLQRIVGGIGTEKSCEEHMIRALELSGSDMQEFLSLFANHRAKYYFAVDGLLLVLLGEGGKSCEYLAEIIELLDIAKPDLEYLCMIAKSILLQQSSIYDAAKAMVNERVRGLNFAPYIRNYYVGAVIDTDTEKYYIAPDKKMSEGLKLPGNFKERKVVFKNLKIELHSDMNFEGCEEISFIDCELISNGSSRLNFSSIGSLSFHGCKISGFKNRVAYIKYINRFDVENCEFLECGYTCSGDERGGVFAIQNNESLTGMNLIGNSLLNCYIGAKTYRSNYGVTGVFVGIFVDPYWSMLGYGADLEKSEIRNNSFSGCRCINNGNYTAAMIGHFRGALQKDNNRSTGEITRIFESDEMNK